MNEGLDSGSAIARLREDGVLEFRSYEGSYDTLETARKNTEHGRKLANGWRLPTIAFIDGSRGGDIEARRHYRDPGMQTYSTAVAMVVTKPLARLIANFYTGLVRLPAPVKHFPDEKSALEWLRKFPPEKNDSDKKNGRDVGAF